MSDVTQVQRSIQLVKALNSSLRLRDVLDKAVMAFVELSGQGKVALFLSDNDSLSLKLMSGKGYSDASFEQLRVLSFAQETTLKAVMQKRQVMVVADAAQAPDISAVVMQREGSGGQIGLPLLASNLLVGAVLVDVRDRSALARVDLLKEVADIAAQAVANAILFGRSEYERERLGTLYKTSVSLSGSALKVSEVLQIACDTALILANTPHCAVLIVDRQKGIFHVATFKGLDSGALQAFDLAIEDTVAGRCVMTGRTEHLADATNIQMRLPRAPGGALFSSVLALPVSYKQEVLAVVVLFSTDMRAFHREQIDLLESLSHQVGTALNVALTHETAASQTVQDAHTGLYNHWHFNDAFGREMERSIRHKHQVALLRIDIDHLTRVNELLGTGKGDEAIRHVARIIRNALRDIDVPCRYGSQEFAVILPETPRASASEVAERLRLKIRSEAAPGVGMVTVSMGLASYPENGDNPQAILKAAEQALDVAKFEGRDRVRLADSACSPGDLVSWDELARQAKLAVLSERQSRLHSRLSVPPEYAPWMRAVPSWGSKKTRSD